MGRVVGDLRSRLAPNDVVNESTKRLSPHEGALFWGAYLP